MVRRLVAIGVAVATLALPAGAAAAPGTLDYRQSFASAPGYTEGAVSFVRVRDSAGRLAVSRRVRHRPSFRLRRRLPAGRYRVVSYQRPCDGSCSSLDEPTDRCARRIRVLSGGLTEVSVTVRPGRGCRISRHALPARFPPAERLRAARSYLEARAGTNSWALVDNWGRLSGFEPQRVYLSASLVKAMLLTAYLRELGNHAPSAADRSLLGPMITVSSNGAADGIYNRVGDARLYALAKLAGMKHFSVAGYWANARFSAEDQARFFNRIDRLTPRASRGYARGLLSSIVDYQRWGFSRYSLARGFRTYFKGGWRGTGAGQLLHEAALFERGPLRISMAVLTDGNPSQAYGQETLRGVARRVFGTPPAHSARSVMGPEEAGNRATRRAGLVDARRFAPSIRVNLSYRTKHNETGAPLPGYCENWALLHEKAAFSLGQVQRYLRRRGLGLLILDAYRPVRATQALVKWAERTGRGGVVGTYIARRSRHNTGSALDITLVRDSDGKRLRLGGFAFGPSSHTYNASGRILRNRLTLMNAMQRFGFSAYLNEWWHFEHSYRPNRYLDVTLGCGRHN
ncbi:MAG TPA: M15 family metallopeptidase [Thermoleophilaceae bacterium]|nr:M15 family metallopeptidase [Thermoleophilaceae bacterium]